MGFDLCVSLRGCFLRGDTQVIALLLKRSIPIYSIAEKVPQDRCFCKIQLRQIRGDQKRFVDVGKGNLILAV